MSNRIRYSAGDVQRNLFYQLPKFLFTEEFAGLSNDAKILYALLRDRHSLSVKNNMVNAKKEVYVIMPREEMCAMLQLSMKTVINAVNALKKYNLLEEERPGQGDPNRIFLLQVMTCKIYSSEEGNPASHIEEDFQPSNTNSSKTDFSDTKERKNGENRPVNSEENYKDIVEKYSKNTSLQSALFGYIEMRSMIHKPLSNYALKKLLLALSGLSNNDDEKIKIVENSITHNYLEFFPLKQVDITSNSSYNTDTFFDAAVKKSYDKIKEVSKHENS